MYVNAIQIKLILQDWINALVHFSFNVSKYTLEAIPLRSWSWFISTAQSHATILSCTVFFTGVSIGTENTNKNWEMVTYSSSKIF